MATKWLQNKDYVHVTHKRKDTPRADYRHHVPGRNRREHELDIRPEPITLTPAAIAPDRHPALMYLASLAAGSHRAMCAALDSGRPHVDARRLQRRVLALAPASTRYNGGSIG